MYGKARADGQSKDKNQRRRFPRRKGCFASGLVSMAVTFTPASASLIEADLGCLFSISGFSFA